MTSILTRLLNYRSLREARRRRTIGKHMVWDSQPLFAATRARHGAIPGIPDLRLYVLQSCIRAVANVPGDIAECGTRFGKSALYMLEALDTPRRMFLFDSFEGLSDPTPGKDGPAADPATGTRFFHDTDMAQVAARFQGRDVALMQGWIPERFPEVADRRFALVHIDVDLYQPSLDSLAFFYERTSPFGMIVCDDYGSGFYPGARQAMDEFFADKPEGIVELPQGQALVTKRPG